MFKITKQVRNDNQNADSQKFTGYMNEVLIIHVIFLSNLKKKVLSFYNKLDDELTTKIFYDLLRVLMCHFGSHFNVFKRRELQYKSTSN